MKIFTIFIAFVVSVTTQGPEKIETTPSNEDNVTILPKVNQKCSYLNLNNFNNSLSSIEDLFEILPWLVYVNDEKKFGGCSGSLIHENVVLTTATCVDGKEAADLIVISGNIWNTSNLKNAQRRKVKKIERHPVFKQPLPESNLALIILSESINLTPDIQLVCLPKEKEEIDEKNCIVAQPPELSSKKPRTIFPVAEISVVSGEACDNKITDFPQIIKETIIGFSKTYICAKTKNMENSCRIVPHNHLICPLSRDKNLFTQIGILINVVGCEGSGTDGYQVFTDIRKEMTWISDTAKTLGYEIII